MLEHLFMPFVALGISLCARYEVHLQLSLVDQPVVQERKKRMHISLCVEFSVIDIEGLAFSGQIVLA